MHPRQFPAVTLVLAHNGPMARTSGPQMSIQLPVELISMVVHFCAKKDLRACSLVARAWSYPTRQRLFRELALVPNFGATSVASLSKLLDSPHCTIGSSVQLLALASVSEDGEQLYPVLKKLARVGVAPNHFRLQVRASQTTLSLLRELFPSVSRLSFRDCLVSPRVLVPFIQSFSTIHAVYLAFSSGFDTEVEQDLAQSDSWLGEKRELYISELSVNSIAALEVFYQCFLTRNLKTFFFMTGGSVPIIEKTPPKLQQLFASNHSSLTTVFIEWGCFVRG